MSLSSAASSSFLAFYQDAHPHVPWTRQLLNFIGCLLIVPLCRAAAVNTVWPATVDLLIGICLAELCRFANEGRRIAWREIEAQPRREKEDVEKGTGAGGSGGALVAEAMASIVGWREDPDLWEKCLESYKDAVGCRFVLVGIDGHDADDKEMVDVFQKVRVTNHSFLVQNRQLRRANRQNYVVEYLQLNLSLTVTIHIRFIQRAQWSFPLRSP